MEFTQSIPQLGSLVYLILGIICFGIAISGRHQDS